MPSPFKKGALTRMKERRAARAEEREVMAAPTETRSLYRSFLEQDITPTEPVRGAAPVEPARERPSDETIDYLMGPQSEDDIILAQHPPVPPSERGERIFPDQDQYAQKIADEVRPPLTFSQAFRTARNAGKAKFIYDGKRFNTMERGESKLEWRAALLGSKPPTPVQKEAIAAPVETTFLPGLKPTNVKTSRTSTQFIAEEMPKFDSFMKINNIKIAEGKNVDTEKINPEMGPALDMVTPMFEAAGIIPEVTSGNRDNVEWSLHETGDALDLRLKLASPAAIKMLKASLGGPGIPVRIHNEKGLLWRKGDFEYIIHGTGANMHLHIERDTKKTKLNLANHLYGLGAGDKVKPAYRRNL